jgi:hypothetical protein
MVRRGEPLSRGSPTQLAGPTVLFNVANTSQGRMVGDYISTSFNSSGLATTVFAVGVPSTGPLAFDEAMYAPTSPLGVASVSAATHVASGSGVQSSGGTGQGSLLRSIRHG